MKMNTLEKGPEACVLIEKAARLSTRRQTTQIQNLCKWTQKKASSFMAQLHILSFTQHLHKKVTLFLQQSVKSKLLCSLKIT